MGHFWRRVCSADKIIPIYFLRISNVWSILHHWSAGKVHKKMLLNAFFFFFFFFFFFHHKIFVFIIFISFLDEVSNFRNRILTSQKHELVVSNCQWNCMRNFKIQNFNPYLGPMLQFYPLESTRKPNIFRYFWGIEFEHWPKMG